MRANGRSAKKLKGDFSEAEILVPRDRDSSFEPKIVAKGQRRKDGFDDKIIAMYSRGMSTRDMQSAPWPTAQEAMENIKKGSFSCE